MKDEKPLFQFTTTYEYEDGEISYWILWNNSKPVRFIQFKVWRWYFEYTYHFKIRYIGRVSHK